MTEEWEEVEGPGSIEPYRTVICRLTIANEADPLTTFILVAVSIVFAAFCVWLTVRIVNRKEQWAMWTMALAVGLPVLYVASFGPACWAVQRDLVSISKAAVVYKPIVKLAWYGPGPSQEFLSWFSDTCGGYWALVAMDDPEEWEKLTRENRPQPWPSHSEPLP